MSRSHLEKAFKKKQNVFKYNKCQTTSGNCVTEKKLQEFQYLSPSQGSPAASNVMWRSSKPSLKIRAGQYITMLDITGDTRSHITKEPIQTTMHVTEMCFCSETEVGLHNYSFKKNKKHLNINW